MQNPSPSYSQLIVSQLTNALTTNMQYKLKKLQHQRQRPFKTKQQSAIYVNDTIDTLGRIYSMKHQINQLSLPNTNDQVYHIGQHVLIKKATVQKIRRNTVLQKKFNLNTPKPIHKNLRKSGKQNYKGLIKLALDQQQDPTLLTYLDKLRDKKQKSSQLYSPMCTQSQKQHTKKQKYQLTQFQNYPLKGQDKMFITNYLGQKIKLQKKQIHSKKNQIYLDKIKIKPLFKFYHQYSNVNSIQDHYLSQIRSSSVEQNRLSLSKEQHYFKTPTDSIGTKKCVENFRKYKNLL